MCDQYENGVLVRIVILAGPIFAADRCAVFFIPSDHSLQTIPEPLMHAAPLFSIFSTTAPILRRSHAIPLILDIHASLLCMSDIAFRDRVRFRESICRGKGDVCEVIIGAVKSRCICIMRIMCQPNTTSTTTTDCVHRSWQRVIERTGLYWACLFILVS